MPQGANSGGVRDHYRGLGLALRVFCFVSFATGLVDMIGGPWILMKGGLALSPAVASDPTLNSQIRFWGAIWFGWGLMLWWAAGDVRGRGQAFTLLMVTLLLSGMARLGSAAFYGVPAPPLIGATALELAASLGFLVWFRRLSATG